MRYAETGFNLEVDLSRGNIERVPTDPRLTELHLGGLGRIDLTGAMALKRLREDIERSGMDFRICEVPGHACRILRQVLEWSPQEEERARSPSP